MNYESRIKNMINKHRIIFMGTTELAADILDRLIQSEIYKPDLVITQPDKPTGRKQILTSPPVKQRIMNHESRIKGGIKIFQPDKLKDAGVIAKIKEEKPDIIIVAAYGKIIPQEILDIPPFGILNVHGSLLPLLRGASPVQTAILEGHKETGPTIMVVDEELDHGPILAQKAFPIALDETAITLMRKMAEVGADLLLEVLSLWFAGKIQPKEQNDSKATLTKIFQKEDGEIKPDMDAEYIERMIRAFNPWPGAYMNYESQIKNHESKKKILKILKARISECGNKLPPMSFFLTSDKKLALNTAKDCLILETVQPEGKKPMSGYDFYLGSKFIIKA